MNIEILQIVNFAAALAVGYGIVELLLTAFAFVNASLFFCAGQMNPEHVQNDEEGFAEIPYSTVLDYWYLILGIVWIVYRNLP